MCRRMTRVSFDFLYDFAGFDGLRTDDIAQRRNRSQRRTASSRLRSCLLVFLLVATRRRT
jgi:hypothetical protein